MYVLAKAQKYSCHWNTEVYVAPNMEHATGYTSDESRWLQYGWTVERFESEPYRPDRLRIAGK
jgi:hypothetical protein